MRKLILFIAVLCLLANFSFAQEDCRPFVPTDEGTSWELTNYSPKGKVTGKIRYELLEKDVDGDMVTFKVQTTTIDKDDEEIYTSEFEAYCKDGEFSFDMAFKIDGAAMQSYQSMDVEVDASEFTVPDLDAPSGTQLPDGSLRVAIQSGAPITINMTVDVTDRSIDAREEVTTPAGTFDCVVVSQTVSTKTVIRVEGSSKEWYAPEIGLVRSESYNRKGKLTGYSELTALEQ